MGNLCCSKREAIPLPRTYTPPEEIKQLVPGSIDSYYRSLPLQASSQCPKERAQRLLGLENLGNTCFMNSALQCIVNTQPLLDYFLIGIFESDINRKNSYGSAGLFASAFASLAVANWRNEGACAVPNYMLELVMKYAPHFQSGTQQDAHEFLLFFLDILHEELNRADKTQISPSLGHKHSCENRAARSWKRCLKNNSSIIVDLFQGQLRSTTKCGVCKGESVKFETFIHLSLPVPRNNCTSLIECFKEFSKQELLSNDNGWICPKCKVKVKASRKCEIWKFPPILIIHLKRFWFDGKKFGKITDLVKYPVKALDLAELAVGPQKDPPEYDLYAQINHKGLLEKGHFYSIIKSYKNNSWYSCDDSEVRPKNPGKIVKNHAYILFYQKSSPTAYWRQQIDLPDLWPHDISLAKVQSTISDEESVSFISNCSHFSGNST
jgi:ubiquitin carboxyl-terminal hydrolase 8